MTVLEQAFFRQPSLILARALLGQYLVREIAGRRLSGRIIETEAYIGPDDTACHASKGRTPRTEVMFGPPGYTYIYLIYGLHSMLNITAEPIGFPAAILIRAIEPLAGEATMRSNRQTSDQSHLLLKNLTNGPGKLCQALNIDKHLNNQPITTGQKLWLESGPAIAEKSIASGPRIGINYAADDDRLAPWRFWIRDNQFVSK